ncbi:MAG: ABC-F family ATP-binding cassette domain-containing protein [Thermodesulfobacteriota bacterium]
MFFVEHLTKGFAAQLLFEDANFTVAPRERIGLVGRNGHGKTTLLRLIVGEEQPDAGSITCPRNYHIGYVRQHIEFTEDTVLKEGSRGLPPAEQDQHWKVEKILAGLGFSNRDMQRHPAEFSGGFQVRLNLVKALVAEPDLLLLDEPTNYLDIASIRWIERFLINWPHELILITHDRSFMDAIATHIMGIHRQKIRKIPGNTEKYYSQIAQDEEIYEKTRINEERRRKEIEQFITRFRAKARLANLVQSRVKTLQKLEKKEKLKAVQELDFSFRSKPYSGKRVLAAQNVTFSYDGKTELIKGFNITIRPQEQICIIGKNGKGKTTLLKLLAGQLTPQSGNVVPGPGVSQGLFEQTNINRLRDACTVEEEIMLSHPDVDRQQARNICGAMMFSGDDALKKIGVLSGGEKSRVMLAKLLVTPANLLLLDEPTHHLDMESCDALLAALADFAGTVVMVTHNEMFLNALADRLIIFQDGGVEVFESGYAEFLESGGWRDEKPGYRPAFADDVKTDASKLTKKEKRRLRSEIIADRSRAIKSLETRIASLEKEIAACEEQLNNLNAEMLAASQRQDGPRIETLSKSLHACSSKVDELYAELEKQSADYDKQRAAFDKRLEEIDK